MKTTMKIDKQTAIPLARFWQEVFLVSLSKKNNGVNAASVDADSTLKIYQRRRKEAKKREGDFIQ